MANSVGIELEGKTVVLKAEVMSPAYQAEDQRTVMVTGGFGASPQARGSALFVTFLSDGVETRFSGYDVERVVD